MYNTDIPARAELPTSARLIRSTAIAAAAATVILVTIVLPSEYAVDPTGIGRVLGLTDMGKIKVQLAAEAKADAEKDAAAHAAQLAAANPVTAKPDSHGHAHGPADTSKAANAHGHDHGGEAATGLAATPTAAPAAPAAQTVAAAAPSTADAAAGRSDKLNFVLAPGQGLEVKMAMKAGARTSFDWTANGAVVNFDAHGDGNGRSVSYKKGNGAPSDTGELVAAFDGYHGWYWRNRTEKDVTMTLRTQGDYAEIKRM